MPEEKQRKSIRVGEIDKMIETLGCSGKSRQDCGLPQTDGNCIFKEFRRLPG